MSYLINIYKIYDLKKKLLDYNQLQCMDKYFILPNK